MKKSAVIILFAIQYFVLGLNTGFAQWNPLCPENLNMGHRGVYFIDDTTGFVVGGRSDTINNYYDGYILRTLNGGQSWDTTYTMCNNSGLLSVYFPCRDTGYAAGSGGNIFKTTDGGAIWNNIPQPFGTSIIWMSTYFVNHNVGYFCSANSGPAIIMKTIDGGQSWTDLDSTANNLGAWDITFPSLNFGIANNGFTTQDAGHTWSLSNIPLTRTYISVNFSNTADIYLVGFGNGSSNYGSIAKSNDGGQSWTNHDYYNTHMLYDVDFSSSNIGYAVGDATLYDQIDILATRDGGLTWWPQQVNYSVFAPMFTSVSAPSDSVAYAISSRGDIYKTTNGGGLLLGTQQLSKENISFSFFPNPSNGFITIKLNNNKGEENLQIKIIDMLGQTVIEKREENISDNFEEQIDFSGLADGIYFLSIQVDDHNIITRKVVKQR